MTTHDRLVNLENQFEAGKITRREFLASGAAIATTAGLMSFTSPYAQAATPIKGGRMRLGIARGDSSDSLDPATVANTHVINVTWQMRNNLVEIGANSEAVPELAESWEASDDAATWVFKIRKDVEFHNGKTLDADDVAYSLNYHIDEKSKSGAKGFMEDIQQIKVDDQHTVVVELERGNADLAYIFGDYHLQIVPNGTTDFSDGVGTGGYILDHYEPGVRALVKRNPNYWKADRAHADEIETLVIADDNARTNALTTGEIDAMNAVDLKTIDRLADIPGLKVLELAGKKHYTMPMLTDRAPYDNNDARLALKYAVDREELLAKILRGHGALGNDHPISPSNRFFAADLPQRTYDPEKAKFHLKKAGLENHVFKIHTADAAFAGAVDTAVLYQAHAAKAGINIQVVREPNDGYWSAVWLKKDWCMAYWSGRPTEDWMFSSAYAAGASGNDSHWEHVRFNELLALARVELDESKRRAMYAELQLLVRDEGGVVVPMFANDIMAMNERVMYENPSSAWELDGLRAGERWWLV
jgi:peptide/nickel transport system substrate-binding protein